MNFEINRKRYYLYSLFILIIVFLVALLQNYIRYGMHEGYDIQRSIVYLTVSLLLFSIFLPPLFQVVQLGVKRYQKNYILFIVSLSVLGVMTYYLLASCVIHLLGFYDGFFSTKYASQYFGREALVHIIMILVTGWVVYRSHSNNKDMRISASMGRKEITIPTSDIQWIEADDHYLKIHTAKEALLKRSTLEDMTKELQPDFIRIHRKYLVNKTQIARKEKDRRDEFVILHSGDKLKVGRSYSPLEW